MSFDGAILVARGGVRRWRAAVVARPRRYMPADEVYRLTPLGLDVQLAQEHGRLNGGVRTIYRSADELRANGWRRVG